MAIKNDKEYLRKNFKNLDESDLKIIKAYLQGAVYCWIVNRKDEYFYARDLVGGENWNWNGTPLQIIYDRLLPQGKDHAEAQAGSDLGWILRLVLVEDQRNFIRQDNEKDQWANSYKWDD